MTKHPFPRGFLEHLLGPSDLFRSKVEDILGVRVSVRGEELLLQDGEGEANGDLALKVLNDLAGLYEEGIQVSLEELRSAMSLARESAADSLHDLYKEARLAPSAKKSVFPRTPKQLSYIETIRQNEIAFGVGPAGTGKTYLAVTMAAEALRDGRVKRIILTRPAVEAGEKLGFLPGDLAEKVNPYLRPLYDALHDLLDQDQVQRYIESGVIEIAPLAFMRGRTLNNACVLLDEGQNTTPEQMKMFLTRLGFGSQAIITGDITQVDLGPYSRSGLVDALDILGEVDGIGITRFSHKDVVRHPLVQKVVLAYEASEKKQREKDGERRQGERRRGERRTPGNGDGADPS